MAGFLRKSLIILAGAFATSEIKIEEFPLRINLWELACYSPIVKFDTTPLAGRIVGNARGFLNGCRILTEVDLSGLRGITIIGDYFLYGCSALVTVRGMGGLAQVVEVGRSFLAESSSLVECDLGQMMSLKKVGDDFLSGSALEQSGAKIVEEIMAAN